MEEASRFSKGGCGKHPWFWKKPPADQEKPHPKLLEEPQKLLESPVDLPALTEIDEIEETEEVEVSEEIEDAPRLPSKGFRN